MLEEPSAAEERKEKGELAKQLDRADVGLGNAALRHQLRFRRGKVRCKIARSQ